ncbi:hypothetical protein D3C86_997110 [compost metagenome]
MLLRLGQTVVDRRQYVGAERVTGQDEALGAPLLPVVLHQFGQVQRALLRALVLPVVAQGVDADHRVADLGHLARHVAVEVAPAAVTGQEQGHGVPGLAGWHFDHRNLQAASGFVAADEDLAQFVVQHLRQVDVVVADAGFGVRLITHETGTGVVRVVVPRHQPVAMGGAFRQQVSAAAGFLQCQVDRDGLGLVILLLGQPAPGQHGARADAADQRRRAFQFPQARLQGAALQQAVLGQDHLDNLRRSTAAQGHQLLVAEFLVFVDRHQHLGAWRCAGDDTGHRRTIGRGQQFEGRLRCRAFQVPETATENQGHYHQRAQYIPQGALNHQRFTNPVKPPAIRAAVSASATSGSSPAGTAI